MTDKSVRAVGGTLLTVRDGRHAYPARIVSHGRHAAELCAGVPTWRHGLFSYEDGSCVPWPDGDKSPLQNFRLDADGLAALRADTAAPFLAPPRE